jgi:hypothetical protein
MPTQMTPEQMTAAQLKAIEPKAPIYRKLLAEKLPAPTDREYVFSSVLLAMAEDIDKIKRAIKFLSDQDIELSAGLNAVSEAVFGGAEEAPPTQAPSTAGGDKTPFPAGANQTGSGPTEPDEVEAPPAPNVKSGPATNAAPIPKASGPKAPTPSAPPANGSKGARQ